MKRAGVLGWRCEVRGLEDFRKFRVQGSGFRVQNDLNVLLQFIFWLCVEGLVSHSFCSCCFFAAMLLSTSSSAKASCSALFAPSKSSRTALSSCAQRRDGHAGVPGACPSPRVWFLGRHARQYCQAGTVRVVSKPVRIARAPHRGCGFLMGVACPPHRGQPGALCL